MDLDACQDFDVDFSAVASGDGLWGMEAGKVVTFDKIHIYFNRYDDIPGGWYGSALAYHDAPAHKNGLCYTDTGLRSAVNSFLTTHPILGQVVKRANCSEHGRQGKLTYDLDLEVRSEMTVDKFKELGFEITNIG